MKLRENETNSKTQNELSWLRIPVWLGTELTCWKNSSRAWEETLLVENSQLIYDQTTLMGIYLASSVIVKKFRSWTLLITICRAVFQDASTIDG